MNPRDPRNSNIHNRNINQAQAQARAQREAEIMMLRQMIEQPGLRQNNDRF